MTEHLRQDNTDDFSPSDQELDIGLAVGFAPPSSVLRALSTEHPCLARVQLHEPDSAVTLPVVLPDSEQMPRGGPTGRYQLQGEIARGGMGCILKGRDADLGREVAVKVLLEQHTGRTELMRRFVEEAQIAGQLQHPGIVPVYEIGALEGRPFFSMKLVKGQTLAQVLVERNGTTQELPRLLLVFERVCQAVAYAHARGVIHRDLKPSNIMLGGFGEVLVMDWGLAKVLHRGGGADEEADECQPAVTEVRTTRGGNPGSGVGSDTQAGHVMGTPGYMAPEQARGEIDLVDERADVFGLGAILCEVLTGQPPFTGNHAEAGRKARTGALDEAHQRLDGCEADAELIGLVKHCLAAEPWQRPRDASAVAEALAGYLGSVADRLRQAELQRAAAEARAAEERRRRRVTMGLATAVLALVVVGGSAGWLWRSRIAERNQDVESSLALARVFREQARWKDARDALERAEQRLGAAGPEEIRRRLQQDQSNLQFAEHLDRIRQKKEVWRPGGFDFAPVDRDYETAFLEAGLARVGEDPAAVAARIQQSALQAHLVAAVDDWGVVAQEQSRQEWLMAVARQADPDPESNRFRDPRVWNQPEALERLANTADVEKLSPLLLTAVGLRVGLYEGKSIAFFRRAQAAHPGDFWLNFFMARALEYAGVRGEAVSFYRAAMVARPGTYAVHNNLGSALSEQGDLDGAIASYQKAIALDATLMPAHLNLGNALAARRDRDGAIACFERALAVDPKDARVYTGLGRVLRDKGDINGAIACYNKAIECAPKNALAHNDLGNALLDKRDLDGAIAEYNKVLQLDPKSGGAYYNLGNARKAKNDLDGAIDAYRKAVALDPREARAHCHLGLALDAQGKREEAIACYKKAIEYDPDLAVAHYDLGNALGAKNDLDGAIPCFRKALALDPKNANTLFGLGHALEGKGDLAGAIDCYEKAIDLNSKLAEAHNGLGTTFHKTNNLVRAIAAYQKAIELKPNYAEAHCHLGIALADKRKPEEAIACYKKALEINPKLSPAHNGLGNALKTQKNLPGAIAAYQKAIQYDPRNAAAHYNLGNVRYNQRDLDRAIACYLQAIACDPKDAQAHSGLGNILYDRRSLAGAVACYQQAIALLPNSADYHFKLGLALHVMPDLQGAIAAYQKAIELNPNYAEAHCNLGHSLRDQGRFADALVSLRRGHELGSKLSYWNKTYPSAEWVRKCEYLIDLDNRLPAILAGMAEPADRVERLNLAWLSQQPYKQCYALSVRLYGDAFADQPKLADDLRSQYRYKAARAAVLAAAGQGMDAKKLHQQEQERLRSKAYDWLRADLAAWIKRWKDSPQTGPEIRKVLAHWQKDADLASIRETVQLEKLPRTEITSFRQLWADVAALAKALDAKP
jgi:serine/threonine-protein kinase